MPNESLPPSGERVSTSARDAAVEVEAWVTVAPAETTGTNPPDAPPLRPARDPADAAPWRPVTWAGRCRSCRRPIWSAAWPGKGPKYCPGDGGGPAMRLWEAATRSPTVTKPAGNREIPWTRETPSADPHKQRGFEGGFVTSGTRSATRRGGATPNARQHGGAAASVSSAARRARGAGGATRAAELVAVNRR